MDSHRSSSRQSETRPWKPLSRSSFSSHHARWDEKWDFVNSRRVQTPRPVRPSRCKITTAGLLFVYSALLYTWWKLYCPWDRRLSNAQPHPQNLVSGPAENLQSTLRHLTSPCFLPLIHTKNISPWRRKRCFRGLNNLQQLKKRVNHQKLALSAIY